MTIEMNEKDRLQKKIKELEERLVDFGDQEMSNVGERINDYGQTMKERGKEIYKKVREKGENVDKYAREHPWIWMGVGILVGLSLGIITAKSMHKKYCYN